MGSNLGAPLKLIIKFRKVCQNSLLTCVGFPCDSFNNPPDFFLDAMMECEGMTSSGEGGGVTVDTLMLKRERSRTISEQTRQYQLSSGQHHLTASYRRSKSGYSVRSGTHMIEIQILFYSVMC